MSKCLVLCAMFIPELLCFVVAAIAWEEPGPRGVLIEGTEIRVIDGDTLECDIALPFGITLKDRIVRALTYDAWESSKRRQTIGVITDEHVAKGKAASAALVAFLSGKRLYLDDDPPPPPGGGTNEGPAFGSDVYGRVVARLWAWDGKAWIDIGTWMENHGHTRPKFRRL